MSTDAEVKKLLQKDLKGETPTTEFLAGTEGIKVSLVSWPENWQDPLTLMAAAPWTSELTPEQSAEIYHLVKAGKMLGNGEEALKFIFKIEGISRACTHQLVRTRIGAVMSQESGRVVDWRHKPVRIPAVLVNKASPEGLTKFVTAVEACKEAYAFLVDEGIPLQDARRVLNIGTTTYLYEPINFRALKGLAANRMCPSQADWEINRVLWLMKEAVEEIYPELAKQLVPRCCVIGKCIHEGDIMPPCGLFPHRLIRKEDYRHPNTFNGAFIGSGEVMQRLKRCKSDMGKED